MWQPACRGHHVVDGSTLLPAQKLQQKILLGAGSWSSLLLRRNGTLVIRCSFVTGLLSGIKAQCRKTSGSDPEPNELTCFIRAPVRMRGRHEPLLDETTAEHEGQGILGRFALRRRRWENQMVHVLSGG